MKSDQLLTGEKNQNHCIVASKLVATGLPRRLLLLLAFPGLDKNLWPLVNPGLSLTVDSSAHLRPLHLPKPFAEVLCTYILAIRAVSLILVLTYTQMARAM